MTGGWRLSPPERAPVQAEAFDERLGIPGMVQLPGIGVIRAKALVLPEGRLPPAHPGRDEYADLELIAPELRVRSKRSGDRFIPLGMSGAKKLQAATGGQHYIETVWGRGYVLRDPADEHAAA